MIRTILVWTFYPLIVGISYVKKPPAKCTYKDWRKIKSLMKPGYLLLSRENFSSSNLFISGFWGHVAICLGKGFILEAVPRHGVRIRHISEFVLESDAVCLMQPLFEYQYRDLVYMFIGLGYDFAFKSKNMYYYCTELYRAFMDKLSPNVLPEARKVFGGHSDSPDDFYKMRTHFKPIYEERHAS